jgi:hypothetical protein
MQLKPPDVMVLCSEWPERALLRAQLVEDGHEVVAIETWPMPKLYRQSSMKPRVMLIDLQGLADPRVTLDEVRFVHPPERALVVTALGSVTAEVVRALGFNVVERPVSIGRISATIAILLAANSSARSRVGNPNDLF